MQKAKELLQWLSSLKSRTSKKVISGQFVCPAYGRPEYGLPTVQDCFEYHVEKLERETGKWLGMIGFDFCNRAYKGGCQEENTPRYESFAVLAQDYSEKGGLITLCWHAPNPWTQDNAWSSIPDNAKLADLVEVGNVFHDQWMTWLDVVAEGLLWFQEKDIPILWRPFHELDGDWFWWGQGDADEFIQLWRHMFHYFTHEKKLNNLLWVFSSDICNLEKTKARYPGNEYVDCIGMDRYSSRYENTAWYEEFSKPAYDKILGYTEVGDNNEGQDNMQIMHEIKNFFPDFVMFNFWMKTFKDFSIVGNQHAYEIMNDEWTCNRPNCRKIIGQTTEK